MGRRRSPCRLRSGRSWGEWKSREGIVCRRGQGRCKGCISCLLPFQPFSFCTPRRREVPDPLRSHPTVPPRPACGISGLWAAHFFSLLARKSPDPAGMPERTASLWTSFPLFGFEDNFHEERLAALGGCLGIERVLISFLVYVYFPIRQRQSFLPYELYIQTITH